MSDDTAALDELASELGMDGSEPSDILAEQSDPEKNSETDSGESLSGTAMQDVLRTQSENELAGLSPSVLEEWQRGIQEMQGDDLDIAAGVAGDVGLHTHFVKAVAGIQSAGDYGTLTVSHNDPMAGACLSPDDGSLTDHTRQWLASDDPLADTLRNEWHGEAEKNLGAALALYFSGSIPRELQAAFESATPEEQGAGMRLLAKFATKRSEQ